MIAYDYPLPPVDMRTMRTKGYHVGFIVEPRDLSYNRGGDGAIKVDEYVKKEYKYKFSIEADDICVKQLKQYLSENMKRGSVVELWGLWAGYYVNTYITPKTRLKRTVSYEKNDAEDEIDRYFESKILRRSTALLELTVDDILFYTENQNVCLTISG